MAEPARKRWGLAAAAVAVAAIAALAWVLVRPWASEAELAQLERTREQLRAYYDESPPVAGWRITAIEVAPPGLLVTLEIPATAVRVAETMPAITQLETAGALCPDARHPIYSRLERFSIEIRPQSEGQPVLVTADCRNVRKVPAAG
jgi:uncharacterized membrane protein YcjF (UPF0283 family)